MTWELIWMLVILKIPVVYLCTVVWWAIRAEPRPPEPAVKTVRAEPEPPPGWRFARVRPHRLRHTYGTQLAAAGIDLLVLRDLMGHASPETTGKYVHLSAETLAAEYTAARKASPW